jgi:cell division protein FtsQ
MNAKAARAAPRGKTKGKAPVRAKGGRGREKSAMGEAVRRASWWIFFLVLAALAVAALAAMRVPQMLGQQLGQAAGYGGFAVKGYEIKGLHRMDRRRIDDIVKLELNRPQPLVDLAELRRQLLQFGWIRDARVSRRLPDRLVIDVVEREPKAIWQHQGVLTLIDLDGVVLDHVQLNAMPDLPLIIGPEANMHAAELSRLVEASPRLRPVMSGATWVGGRRWDIRFQTGEVLALPEGDVAAQKALTTFARQDQEAQLLGRGFVRFDMRVPGKLIARISSEPGSSIPAIAPAEPPPAPAPAHAPAKAAAGDVDASKTI